MWAWALHVLCARTVREGRALSENGSIADLSEHTVMPYAERGWICVSGSHMYVCMHVVQHVSDGQVVVFYAYRGRPAVTGSRKVDSYYTNFSFAL